MRTLNKTQRQEIRSQTRLIQRYATAIAEANAAERDGATMVEIMALSRAIAYCSVLTDDEPLGGAWTGMQHVVERRLEALLRD